MQGGINTYHCGCGSDQYAADSQFTAAMLLACPATCRSTGYYCGYERSTFPYYSRLIAPSNDRTGQKTLLEKYKFSIVFECRNLDLFSVDKHD